MARLNALKGVLGVLCLSHLAIGAALFAGGESMLRWIASLYGVAELPLTPEFVYIVKPLGAYMVAMGLMAAAAIRDPARNRIVIYGVAALLVMRVAQRFIYADLITSAFGISPTQLYVQSGFFLALAIALVLLRPKTTPA